MIVDIKEIGLTKTIISLRDGKEQRRDGEKEREKERNRDKAKAR